MYVAILNEETGKFELSWADGRPNDMSKEKAVLHYQNCLALGQPAILMEKVVVDVKITIRE